MLNISAVDAFCCCAVKGEACWVVEVALDGPKIPVRSSTAPPCVVDCAASALSSSIRSMSALLGGSPPLLHRVSFILLGEIYGGGHTLTLLEWDSPLLHSLLV